jgi:palmitoyltransferase
VPRDGDAYRSAVTVKSDGGARFCKKCQARKPDRAHHCSTCRRCVLKMDHHCPWLATCVGFRNYKPFLLFLVYSSLFAWLCFLVSATWLYHEVMIDRRFEDTTMPVHFVILSVISGIIALVLSAFSGYHVYLTSRNRTTIESLEKTRYLSPLRERADQRLHEPRTYVDGANDGFGERLRHFGTALTEMHVNALPGVLRSEEGEGDDTGAAPSPALASLRRAAGSAAVPPPTNPVAHAPYDTYHPPSSSSATFPRGPSREERQYDAYLDERDSARLPHAFDLGWRRNMLAVLGPSPLRWFLPVCNSPGDGWTWERSPEWARRRDALRLARVREREERERQALAAREERGRREAGPPRGVVAPWREAEAEEGEEMLPPPPRGAAEAEDEDEEDLDGGGDDARRRLLGPSGPSDPHPGTRVAAGWNDVPTDMLGRPPGRKKSGR